MESNVGKICGVWSDTNDWCGVVPGSCDWLPNERSSGAVLCSLMGKINLLLNFVHCSGPSSVVKPEHYLEASGN